MNGEPVYLPAGEFASGDNPRRFVMGTAYGQFSEKSPAFRKLCFLGNSNRQVCT